VAKDFGARVRAEREKQELSQMKLAERAKLHFTFVSSIERGRRNVTLTTICRLAEGLGIDPSALVQGLRLDLQHEGGPTT
jgi:transcriptional regulator with XRE-family HTH domain